MTKSTSILVKNKKFKIKELLDSMPYKDRKKKRQELIELMAVSESTFNRVIYANRYDKQDISATNLIKISEFFEVAPADVLNETMEEDFPYVGKTILVK